jgi:hypothetical protein
MKYKPGDKVIVINNTIRPTEIGYTGQVIEIDFLNRVIVQITNPLRYLGMRWAYSPEIIRKLTKLDKALQ